MGAGDVVADERLLDGLDDGDPAGDGCLVEDGLPVLFRDSEQFLSAFGEQGLVACHDGFAVFD